MSCDVNWLKLQMVIKQKQNEKQASKVTKNERSSTSIKNDTTRKQQIPRPSKTKTTVSVGQDANVKASKSNSASKSFSAPNLKRKETNSSYKKLGVKAETQSYFSKEDWDDVNFDVMPAPKILKRDRIFEKFLLDDQGYLIDGLETSDQKERSAFQKRDPERGEDHLRIPERIKETANSNRQLQLELPTSMMEPTKAVALDCEMVGALKAGSFSLLARVSIVNSHGHPLYDKYVKPEVDITDYRTELSGITAEKLSEKGEPLQKVQKEVAQLLKGRVVIGHAIPNDFKVLFLSHPKRDTRDTSMYPPFRKLASGPRKTPALRVLAEKILGIQIQSGEHDSIQDAQVAMKLYMTNRSKWECWLGRKLAKLKGKQELEVVEQDGSLSKGKEPRKRKRKKGRGSKSK